MEYFGTTRPTVASSGGEQSSGLWPCEARLRNLTYSSSIHVRMTQTTERSDPEMTEPEKSTRVTSYCLCRVRTMLPSIIVFLEIPYPLDSDNDSL